jgi:hypothetical protein
VAKFPFHVGGHPLPAPSSSRASLR